MTQRLGWRQKRHVEWKKANQWIALLPVESCVRRRVNSPDIPISDGFRAGEVSGRVLCFFSESSDPCRVSEKPITRENSKNGPNFMSLSIVVLCFSSSPDLLDCFHLARRLQFCPPLVAERRSDIFLESPVFWQPPKNRATLEERQSCTCSRHRSGQRSPFVGWPEKSNNQVRH